ncbi:peptidoglycan bridge formation glycyltransferase FemA/FemB family protein, partial [uncultured Streptococcus sp.]|uniref:peptidoglycan bridge formation glycyltransferase FemA/FemB family protein n=1 Tax=uncultured Streptococcus sp. TaxID=83427 RepID=UPI0028D2E466
MFSYKIGISAQEHDDFVTAHSQANLLQSAAWAQIKDNWGNERLGFYKDDHLVAAASVLIKPLPLGMTMLYIPRGPIMDYGDKELLTFVLASLKKFAKEKKALFVKFDPSLFLAESKMGGELQDNTETVELIQQLQEAEAVWVGRTESLDETIQPRLQANIHKEDFSEELLSKSTRQAIRTARNKGIQIQFGGAELLDDFSALMKKTENRKNIHLRGKDYYQKLLDTYPEHSYVTLSTIDLKARLEDLQAQL